MRPEDLLHPTPRGLYCPVGDFHVDPVRAVERAIITHAHSDHARKGHAHVLATRETLDLMAIRLGPHFAGQSQALGWGEHVEINGVRISLHPAGHVLGSAQVRLEWRGLTMVVSGDYKDVPDPTCPAFTPLPCHVFISEATFGLPVFHHPPPGREVARLLDAVRLFPERTHIIGAYSLGKAQRMMTLLRSGGYDAPLLVHGALERTSAYYQQQGIGLGRIIPLPEQDPQGFAGRIILAPPTAMRDQWFSRFGAPVICHASGWMRVRARQRGAGLPLIISDHADWSGLTTAIRATGCEELWVTHGAEDALLHWAGTCQLRARALDTICPPESNSSPDAV